MSSITNNSDCQKQIVLYYGSGLNIDHYIILITIADLLKIPSIKQMKLICIDPLLTEPGSYWGYKDLKVSVNGDHIEFHQVNDIDYKRPDYPCILFINGYYPDKSVFRKGDIVIRSCSTVPLDINIDSSITITQKRICGKRFRECKDGPGEFCDSDSDSNSDSE